MPSTQNRLYITCPWPSRNWGAMKETFCHRCGHLCTQNLLGRNMTALKVDLPLSADINRFLCPCWKTPVHVPVSVTHLVCRLCSNRLRVMPLFSQNSGSSVDLYLSLTATSRICYIYISAFSLHRNNWKTNDVFHQQVPKYFLKESGILISDSSRGHWGTARGKSRVSLSLAVNPGIETISTPFKSNIV